MDAQTKLNKMFLSCNICTEIFKDPCTLDCQHTFCRVCVTKYTRTRRDAVRAKSVQCPNCLQMTKVSQPQEPVGQWSQQFKPSFLMRELLDTFSAQESSDPIDNCCIICQRMGKTTQAISVCEDCDILLCEACVQMHIATPMAENHMTLPLGAASTPQLKNRHELCKEHNCLVDFSCKNCQKAVCNKCCIVYHKKCNSPVIQISMIPDGNQATHQDPDDIRSHLQRPEEELEEISQEALDLNRHALARRKEKKLLDELENITAKPTGELKDQIKPGRIDLQAYQLYTHRQSREITGEIYKKPEHRGKTKKIELENKLNDQLDRTLELGHLTFKEDWFNLHSSPKLWCTVKTKTWNEKKIQDLSDIEVLNIDGTETIVLADYDNSSVKSCYTKHGIPYCTSLKLDEVPHALTEISRDTVAVSHVSHNSIELIKLTPDPVHISSIKTKKQYRCLTSLSDTTLAAGCRDPPSIDVLDLSGSVLRSVTTPRTGQHSIQDPMYLCTTPQGHIVVVDAGSSSVSCVTQQGEVLYRHQLTEGFMYPGGVTTTDTGSVIIADTNDNKIVKLTEIGEYVRDLLTGRDGIETPRGILVHMNKLYVTELERRNVKVFQ